MTLSMIYPCQVLSRSMRPGMAALLLTLLVMTTDAHGQDPATQPASTSSPAQTRVQKVLQDRSFPWYDAKQDSFRPLKPVVVEKHEDAAGPSPSAQPTASILMWCMIAVMAFVLLMLILQWTTDLTAPTVRSQDVQAIAIDTERLEALPQVTHGVRDLLGEATRLAAQGMYGQAMAFYASWQLVRLDQSGNVELQKGKTNRQYLREVERTRPELRELLRDSMRLFEDAFFGHLTVSEGEFLRVWNRRVEFESLSRGRGL